MKKVDHEVYRSRLLYFISHAKQVLDKQRRKQEENNIDFTSD